MVSIRQMKYEKERKTKVLAKGTYKGFDYYILSLGTHPTAYINTKHIQFSEWDYLPVHGGITYSKNYLKTPTETLVHRGNVVGWDYAHSGDQYGTQEYEFDRKHKTSEILKDIIKSIDYIKNGMV